MSASRAWPFWPWDSSQTEVIEATLSHGYAMRSTHCQSWWSGRLDIPVFFFAVINFQKKMNYNLLLLLEG